MTTENVSRATVAAWFGERLPEEWTSTAPEVTVDREEIVVVLHLPGPSQPGPEAPSSGTTDGETTDGETTDGGDRLPTDEEAEPAARAAAIAGRIARFRADTRDRRITIAREAERRFGRKVAWAVECGGEREVFTSLAVPVMTRLRQGERLVLDTLVDAGVARSRAHALAWCVRLVGENTSTWLADLRAAMETVERVRETGPRRAD